MKGLFEKGFFWLILFSVIQLLAFWIIQTGSSAPGFLFDFPKWLLQFILLECIFSFNLFFFIRHFWSKENDTA